jgi:hypothetical protein
MCLPHASYCFLEWLTFRPWRWRQYIPPKRGTFSRLHGVTNKNATFFIVTNLSTLIPLNSQLSYAKLFLKARHFVYLPYYLHLFRSKWNKLLIPWSRVVGSLIEILKKYPKYYWNQSFVAFFLVAFHWKPHEVHLFIIDFIRSILISSSHLPIGLPGALLLSVFKLKHCLHISSLQYVLQDPSRPLGVDYRNIWWRVQIKNLLVRHLLILSYFLLVSCIFRNTLCSTFTVDERYKQNASKNYAASRAILGSLFDPEYWGDAFLRYFGLFRSVWRYNSEDRPPQLRARSFSSSLWTQEQLLMCNISNIPILLTPEDKNIWNSGLSIRMCLLFEPCLQVGCVVFMGQYSFCSRNVTQKLYSVTLRVIWLVDM